MKSLTRDIWGMIFSYMNEYEITEILIQLPEWDIELDWIEKMVKNNHQDQYKKSECQCGIVTSPLMGQLIKIIELSRYELLEFYRKIFENTKYDEFIFSWVIMFGEESFVEYYWKQKKDHTNQLFRFYMNSTHLIYGLELISFKMRNRFPIHDFISVLNMIHLHTFQNRDIDYLYNNYYRVERKRPLPIRLFLEIQERYRSWILLNPSFMFLYIEKSDQEVDEDES